MEDYMMKIRKVVGHMPLIVNASGVILLDLEKRVLLEKRADNNTWCIPGGCMELREELKETASREVYEETGLLLDTIKLFNVYSGESQHHIYPNGDEVYFVNTIYICDKFHGKINVDKTESKEIRFFDINDLPEKITLSNKPILEDLKEFLNK